MSVTSSDEYRCPGENYTISRAVHLGRLLQGYPGCRGCPRAGETTGLSERQLANIAEMLSRPAAASLFYEEGARSATIDALSARQAHAMAWAWARSLAERRKSEGPLKVVVASDGRAATAALNATICEGIRSSGATVIDAGPASSACLVRSIDKEAADGGLLIGTPIDFPVGACIRFWETAVGAPQKVEANLPDKSLQTQGVVPLSQGANLLAIEAATAHDPPPTEGSPGSPRYGGLVRSSARDDYLESLRPFYHALRPLRVVLGTSCRPVASYLDELTRNVSCKIVARNRPIDRLAEQIVSHRPHFAVEIDDDGERCRVWTERVQSTTSVSEPTKASEQIVAQADEVSPEILLAWIATRIQAETAVLESTSSPELVARLTAAGMRIVMSNPLRQSMAMAMTESQAIIGGGPSGRIWYAGNPSPVADALQTVTLMFNLLSENDQPLSALLPT